MPQSLDTQGQGPFGRATEGPHMAWDGGVQVSVSGEWDVRLRCLSSAQGLRAGTQGPSEPITGQSGSGWESGGEPRPGPVVGKRGGNQSGWQLLRGRQGSGGWSPAWESRGYMGEQRVHGGDSPVGL